MNDETIEVRQPAPMKLMECPRCGGKKSLQTHCGHEGCDWYCCTYCNTIGDEVNWFVAVPRQQTP